MHNVLFPLRKTNILVLFCLLLLTRTKAQCTFTLTSSASTICAGRSVTLSASGTTNYTFTPGGNGASIVDSPSATQTYTVNGSDGACTTTQTITVVVATAPTVAASSNTPAICLGSSAVLSATSNISGPDAGLYWMPGMSTAPTITVVPSASSVYTVVAFTGGGACTASTTVQLPMYANPSLGFSLSESSLCSGNSLTITPSGAVSYTIVPGNYTTTSNFYLTATATNYTVTGKDANTCTASAVVPVTVVPSPTLIITQTPTFVCAGQSTTLSASGADIYNWQPGNFSSGTVVISPTVSGIYTALGYNNAGCSGTSSTSLVVNNTPTLNILNTNFATCSGAPLTLSVSGASTYTWLPSNSSGSVLTVNPSGNTTYTVTGTGTNSCWQSTYATIVVAPIPVVTITGASTLCAGGSLTLTAGGASTFTWAPGNVSTASTIVTPSSTQVFTVNAHSSAGCSGSTTATVSVIPVPSLTLSSSASTICLGQSVDILATGAQNYTWMPGSINSDSFSATPNTDTYYKLTGATSGCESKDSLLIVVLPVPIMGITGDTTVCEGEQIVLFASGAITYSWAPPFASGPQLTVTATTSTEYTVTGWNSYNCLSEAKINVVVSPTPGLIASASPGFGCGPQTHTLSVNGANTYSWQPGNFQVSTFTISPTSSQVYTVSGGLGDCKSSVTVSINVLPLPNISVVSTSTLLCAGEPATLAVSGANTYSWDSGSANDTLVIFPSAMTTYIVSGTNVEGCSTTHTFVQQVSDCTGIEESRSLGIVRIYPNPNRGNFQIDIIQKGSQDYNLSLYNLQGQLVFSTKNHVFPITINVQGIEEGIYILAAEDAETHARFVARVAIGD